MQCDPETGTHQYCADEPFYTYVGITIPTVGGAQESRHKSLCSVSEHYLRSQIESRQQRQTTLDRSHLLLCPKSPGGSCAKHHAEHEERWRYRAHSGTASLPKFRQLEFRRSQAEHSQQQDEQHVDQPASVHRVSF